MQLEFNYTVSIFNMTLFLFLLEGIIIYNKEKIKSSFLFVLFSLILVYIVDLGVLILLNVFFKWFKNLIILILSQSLLYILFSLVYIIYYLIFKYFVSKKQLGLEIILIFDKMIYCLKRRNKRLYI